MKESTIWYEICLRIFPGYRDFRLDKKSWLYNYRMGSCIDASMLALRVSCMSRDILRENQDICLCISDYSNKKICYKILWNYETYPCYYIFIYILLLYFLFLQLFFLSLSNLYVIILYYQFLYIFDYTSA